MTKEKNCQGPERGLAPELDPSLVAGFAQTFLSRDDYYPRQQDTGGYFVVDKPLHVGVVMAHLRGAQTIGAYALSPTSEAKWLCFDADDPEKWADLKRLAASLAGENVTSYLELSRRGGHLWLCTPPTPGKNIRRMGQHLLEEHEIDGVELYPKQDALSTGPGSLVRLPLGIHRMTGKRYGFVTLDGRALAPSIREQLNVLSNPERVSYDFLEAVLARAPKEQPPPLPQFTKQEIQGGLPSQKIKATVPLDQFISQYVKLDAQGKGHCPFHDDEHKSFQIGVGKYGLFWSCYAECGVPHGGDIIHFWQRMRQKNGQDDSFIATITDLARMLVK